MNDIRIIISYKGIPDGNHKYDFTIGDRFFEELGYSEFEHGKLHVHVAMEKRNEIMAMDLSITGEVEVSCDRCLDMFLMPVQYAGRVYATESGDSTSGMEEEELDMVEVNPSRMEVDLTHYIYESICLSLPLQRFHPEDAEGRSTCNADMIKILHSHMVRE
ncbi:MAG: YceD family protein [Bacteroidales bacterium]